MKKQKRKNKITKNCHNCSECLYLGEGDYACMSAMPPVTVIEDWSPTEKYLYCGGKNFKS